MNESQLVDFTGDYPYIVSYRDGKETCRDKIGCLCLKTLTSEQRKKVVAVLLLYVDEMI